MLLRDTVHAAAVDAGVEEGNAEAPGVLLQGLHRVEPHRLIVDQAHEELHRVVPLQPGGLVGGDGEGRGCGFPGT